MIRRLWLPTCTHPHHAANLVLSIRRAVAAGEDTRRVLEIIEPVLFDGRASKSEVVAWLSGLGWVRDHKTGWRCGACAPAMCGECRASRRWGR